MEETPVKTIHITPDEDGRAIVRLYGKEVELHKSMFKRRKAKLMYFLEEFGETYEVILDKKNPDEDDGYGEAEEETPDEPTEEAEAMEVPEETPEEAEEPAETEPAEEAEAPGETEDTPEEPQETAEDD